MCEVHLTCRLCGKVSIKLEVPDNYTEEQLYKEALANLDVGELEYSPSEVDIEIDLVRYI